MKKKRGLSLDDKRNILMQLFKKEQSFFHYKDIEKFCEVFHTTPNYLMGYSEEK